MEAPPQPTMAPVACIECAVKHAMQAHVLLMETRKGYPGDVLRVVGHLAEAEDHLALLPLTEMAQLWANILRQHRKALCECAEVDIAHVASQLLTMAIRLSTAYMLYPGFLSDGGACAVDELAPREPL